MLAQDDEMQLQKTSKRFPELKEEAGGHTELEFPDQPRPGADVHRTRPRRAAARHRGRLGITERSAYGIVTELAEAGYVVKQKDGRRNRYQIQAHLPLPEPLAGNARSARSWPFLPAPARRCDRQAPAGAARHGSTPLEPNFAAPSLTERAGARMSSPSQPAHLSNHQRNTLRQIFQHPAGHNIEWRAVLSLLAAVGSAEERPDGKVAVTIGSQTEYFDPPRHKDIDTQAVVNLRQILTQAGYGADAAEPPAGSRP